MGKLERRMTLEEKAYTVLLLDAKDALAKGDKGLAVALYISMELYENQFKLGNDFLRILYSDDYLCKIYHNLEDLYWDYELPTFSWIEDI